MSPPPFDTRSDAPGLAAGVSIGRASVPVSPPAGEAFRRLTFRDPGLATSLARSGPVTLVPETKVVVRLEPPRRAVAPFRNALPMSWRSNPGLPAQTASGKRLASMGGLQVVAAGALRKYGSMLLTL